MTQDPAKQLSEALLQMADIFATVLDATEGYRTLTEWKPPPEATSTPRGWAMRSSWGTIPAASHHNSTALGWPSVRASRLS